ncbi:TPA: hypothetical protein ACXPQL_004142 [Salmonella enterica]
MPTLPQTRAAWREMFKDGLPWAAIELAKDTGVMSEQRFLHAFQALLNTRKKAGHSTQQVIENARALEVFRYHWEPKHFPGE